MSVLTVMDLKLKPEHAEDLKKWFRDEIHHTRGFDGCNKVTIHSDQDDPNHLFVLGDWDSRQHHEKYLAWRVEKGDVEAFMKWVAGNPVSYYFDSVEM